MQSSFLLNQSLNITNRLELSQLITESLYFNISQLSLPRFKQFKESSISCIDFDHSQGEFLLSGDTQGSIRLFNVDLKNTSKSSSGTQLVGDISKGSSEDSHRFGITSLKWWPNDTGMFLSSSYEGDLKIWDSSTLTQAFQFNIESKINNFAINPTKSTIAVASSHIRLLDLRTTSSSQTLLGHESSVLSCEWSPTKENVLASGDSGGEVKIWDVRFMKRCLIDLDIQKTYITLAEEGLFSSKKPKLISREISKKAHIGGVNCVKFHENGKTLVTTGMDDKVRVWDLEQNVNTLLNFGPLIKNRKPNYKNMIITPFNETAAQYLFYTSDTGEILLYRLFDGKLVTRLRINERNTCISYSGFNYGILFSGLANGQIISWGSERDDLEGYLDFLKNDSDSDSEIS